MTFLLGQLLGGIIELRVQQSVHLFWADAVNGFLLVNQLFIHHVHRNLHGSTGSALAAAGLQHPKAAAFHGKFNILHVFVMQLELGRDLHELLIGFGQVLGHVLDFLSVANAGHHVFSLGIQQVIAIHFLLAGRRIAGEGNAGAGIITHVAKNHGHDVDSRAQVIGNAGRAAVIHGALALPGFEDRFGR